MRANFKKGDDVAVCDYKDQAIRIVHVARVGEREIRLADGSRWRARDGREVGETSRGFTTLRVRHVRAVDVETVAAVQRRASLLERMKRQEYSGWSDLRTEQLEAIVAALDSKPVAPDGDPVAIDLEPPKTVAT